MMTEDSPVKGYIDRLIERPAYQKIEQDFA
jgi:hypothetical protein